MVFEPRERKKKRKPGLERPTGGVYPDLMNKEKMREHEKRWAGSITTSTPERKKGVLANLKKMWTGRPKPAV